MQSYLWMQIVFLLGLIGVAAFFVASEIAIISLNDAKVRHQAEEGDKKAKIIKRLMEDPGRLLATIQIMVTVATILSGTIAEDLAEILKEHLNNLHIPISVNLSKVLSLIIATGIITYLELVLGELVPKRMALQKAEGISRAVASTVDFLSKILKPVITVMTYSTNAVVRLLGGSAEVNQEKYTEEEIRMYINAGEVPESEKEMIDSVFEFDDTFAKEVMTPRIDVVCIPVDTTLDEIIDLTVKEQFSRLPVYEDTIDNIIGILNVKDLFQVFKHQKEEKFAVRDYIRPAVFVPENQKTDDLLKLLQEKRTEIAVVIDEYGGTAGLITIEDLVEEIVGNIMDEYDEFEEKEIEKIDENTYIVNGILSVGEINDELRVSLPEEGADTIGGFVLGILGRIPEEDENPTIEYDDFVFKIVEMDDRRVAKVKIGINKKTQDETAE